jgi:hypothetical protein
LRKQQCALAAKVRALFFAATSFVIVILSVAKDLLSLAGLNGLLWKQAKSTILRIRELLRPMHKQQVLRLAQDDNSKRSAPTRDFISERRIARSEN